MSVNKTLEERGSRYGAFADHARIAQGIQDTMRNAPKWDQLDPDMKQALSVIADKIARILNGDPFYVDNWHDICGYSMLIENRINMLPDEPVTLFEEPSENPDRIMETTKLNIDWNNPALTSAAPSVVNNYVAYDKSECDSTNVGQYRG